MRLNIPALAQYLDQSFLGVGCRALISNHHAFHRYPTTVRMAAYFGPKENLSLGEGALSETRPRVTEALFLPGTTAQQT